MLHFTIGIKVDNSANVAIGHKLLQIFINGRKWSQTITNGHKQLRMVANGSKRSQMVANGHK